VGTTILAVFHQLSSTDSLVGKVRLRTYARLGPVNAWLDRQIEQQWKTFPSEIIPDAEALAILMQYASRASAIQRRADWRARFVESGRIVGASHIGAAVLAAALIYGGWAPLRIAMLAVPVFFGGVGMVVVLLGLVGGCAMGILHGSDV
jgi:hypothetical protein